MFPELYWFLDQVVPLLNTWMGGGLGRRWDINLDPNMMVRVYLYEYVGVPRTHYSKVVWVADPKSLAQALDGPAFVTTTLAHFVRKLDNTPPTLFGE